VCPYEETGVAQGFVEQSPACCQGSGMERLTSQQQVSGSTVYGPLWHANSASGPCRLPTRVLMRNTTKDRYWGPPNEGVTSSQRCQAAVAHSIMQLSGAGSRVLNAGLGVMPGLVLLAAPEHGVASSAVPCSCPTEYNVAAVLVMRAHVVV
jgi:hypothetical protein